MSAPRTQDELEYPEITVRSADISPCKRFRYGLLRGWRDMMVAPNILHFVMLNPSTADAEFDDATIRRCVGFANRMGFNGIVVSNLFAFRSTDPKALKAQAYPRGHGEDGAIIRATDLSNMTIAGWGAEARGLQRPGQVMALLQAAGVQVFALKLTADGIPRHPLYLSYSCKPMPYQEQDHA